MISWTDVVIVGAAAFIFAACKLHDFVASRTPYGCWPRITGDRSMPARGDLSPVDPFFWIGHGGSVQRWD